MQVEEESLCVEVPELLDSELQKNFFSHDQSEEPLSECKLTSDHFDELFIQSSQL